LILACHCGTHQTPLHVAWNPKVPGSREDVSTSGAAACREEIQRALNAGDRVVRSARSL
jgi:hypothetical protein